MRRSALGCTAGSCTLNSLLCLITILQVARGRLWDLCSASITPVVSMVSSGFPQDRQQQEEAGSAAAKEQLGQHMQNVPQSQGGCRQVGYLGSVLGMVGNCVSPYQGGKTSSHSCYRN